MFSWFNLAWPENNNDNTSKDKFDWNLNVIGSNNNYGCFCIIFPCNRFLVSVRPSAGSGGGIGPIILLPLILPNTVEYKMNMICHHSVYFNYMPYLPGQPSLCKCLMEIVHNWSLY